MNNCTFSNFQHFPHSRYRRKRKISNIWFPAKQQMSTWQCLPRLADVLLLDNKLTTNATRFGYVHNYETPHFLLKFLSSTYLRAV